MEASRRLGSGALLVDVREADEYAQARVPGSTHLPLSQFADRVDELPADREVVLLCAAGMRSAMAADYLARRGLTATNLEGGIQAWYQAGLPVEVEESA
jgi:rhodanese-related sulfurtransferase